MGNERDLGDGIRAFFEGQEDYAELEPGATNDESQLLINWGKKGFGFGQLLFYVKDGVLTCDNECMSREFCKGVLEKLTEPMSYGDLPPLIRQYQTLDALLDAAVPRHPTRDWVRSE